MGVCSKCGRTRKDNVICEDCLNRYKNTGHYHKVKMIKMVDSRIEEDFKKYEIACRQAERIGLKNPKREKARIKAFVEYENAVLVALGHRIGEQ